MLRQYILANYFDFRIKREVDAQTVEINFDFVLNGIYDPQLSASEMDDNTYEQFDILIEHMFGAIESGGMEISGLQLQENPYEFWESLIDCEFGTVMDFSTFTCSKCFFLF